MFLIVLGIATVLASVAGGFLLERGQVGVLVQPAEFLIIVGGSVGVLVAGNPRRNLIRLMSGLKAMMRDAHYTPQTYTQALKLLYSIFTYARRFGPIQLENQLEEPDRSTLFAPFPDILKDASALSFLCDSIRVAEAGGLDASQLDALMSIDLDVRRQSGQQLVASLSRVADTQPGLGIVAAVLGVVVTMQSLDGPTDEIGHKVAAALVGTFLGILLCYGVVGPVASHLGARNKADAEYLHVLRAGIIAFRKGASPLVAAEYARRSIPVDLRPSYEVMEDELRRNTRLPEVTAPQED